MGFGRIVRIGKDDAVGLRHAIDARAVGAADAAFLLGPDGLSGLDPLGAVESAVECGECVEDVLLIDELFGEAQNILDGALADLDIDEQVVIDLGGAQGVHGFGEFLEFRLDLLLVAVGRAEGFLGVG